MGTINKIDIEVYPGESNAVKDLKLEVFINGNKTHSEIKYKSFNVYNYYEGMEICDLSNENKLSNDYLLEDNQTYYVEIEELEVVNNNFNIGMFQSEGYVFVYGNELNDLKDYCSDSNDNKTQNFKFVYDHKAVQNEIVTIGAEETEPAVTTTDTVEEVDILTPPTTDNTLDTNLILYGVIGVLLVVVIVLSIVIARMSKNKNNQIVN